MIAQKFNQYKRNKYFLHFLTLIIALMANTYECFAAPIDYNKSKIVATNFIRQYLPDIDTTHIQIYTMSELLIINFSTDSYVIMPNDDIITPILAYSTESIIDVNNIPPALDELLNQYAEEITQIKMLYDEQTAEINRQWESLISGEMVAQRNVQSVDPLLSTNWGQSSPYNSLCPTGTSVGCVALAMGQVMNYWQYPTHGYSSNSYTATGYGTLTANFANTTYQYSLMPATLTSSSSTQAITAVATLLSHCGIAVNMGYSSSGSGAYTVESSEGMPSAEYAMRRYFGFPCTKGIQRSNYTTAVWTAMIKSELDSLRPVIYSGSGSAGGHSFVCDGYNSSNMFHFNFGWNGYGNGYFTLSNINPLTYTFNSTQEAVIGLKPSMVTPDSDNIIYVTPSGNGSRNGNSWNNATADLNEAVGMAMIQENRTQVWVAEGTYYGDGFSGNNAFTVRANVDVYGSLQGNESPDFNLELRNYSDNPSILDGQNTQRVLGQPFEFGTTATALWDGFEIRNGYIGTTSGFEDGAGAKIQTNSTLSHCKIYNNTNVGDLCYGGGVFLYYATLSDCYLYNNTNSYMGGGGYAYYSDVINCVITNNSGNDSGGGLYADNANLTNCTVAENSSTYSSGKDLHAYSSTIYNSIIWNSNPNGSFSQSNNSTIEYTAITGTLVDGEGNLLLESSNNGSDDSLNYVRFVQVGTDWSLQPNSACIDAGTNLATLPPYDILGNPRINNDRVDLGAYELSPVSIETHNSNNEILIFPNPSCDKLNIVTENNNFLTWHLYNIIGHCVANGSITSLSTTINTTNLSPGCYILQIKTNNNKTINKKIIKTK